FDPATGGASGAIEISAASGQSGNRDRDRDMQSKVLESSAYPEIEFTLAHRGASALMLGGTLRLHGTDHEVTLPLKVSVSGSTFQATTEVEIPYVAWGMKDPSNAILRVSKTVQLEIETAGALTWPKE